MRKKLHSNVKHHSAPHMDPSFRHMTPVASPNSYEASGPYVDPPSFHPRIPNSPLPSVVFHAMPPSESVGIFKHPYKFSINITCIIYLISLCLAYRPTDGSLHHSYTCACNYCRDVSPRW